MTYGHLVYLIGFTSGLWSGMLKDDDTDYRPVDETTTLVNTFHMLYGVVRSGMPADDEPAGEARYTDMIMRETAICYRSVRALRGCAEDIAWLHSRDIPYDHRAYGLLVTEYNAHLWKIYSTYLADDEVLTQVINFVNKLTSTAQGTGLVIIYLLQYVLFTFYVEELYRKKKAMCVMNENSWLEVVDYDENRKHVLGGDDE